MMALMGAVVDLLGRRVYGHTQVDHLLGLKGGTARRWIDGYDRGDRHYQPIVRPESTGDELVTWGEFVEARFLAGYRELDVPIQRIRPVVEKLREQLGTPYPLAHARLYAANRELVHVIQDQEKLDEPLQIIQVRDGQMVLSPVAKDFVRAVQFDAGVARTMTPDLQEPAITLDPARGFGEPTIDGIRTDIIAELVRAGDSPDMVAEMYGLTVEQVRSAERFERSRAA